MSGLNKFLKAIDWMSEKSGQIGKWFALVLVFAGSYEAIARHFFNAPTIWSYDTMCMAGGIIYMLGASYNFKYDAHTRVDLFYMRGDPENQGRCQCPLFAVSVFPADDHHVQTGRHLGHQSLENT